MRIRHLLSAAAAGLLTCGLLAITPAPAWSQEPTVLPEKGGPITVTGCFMRVKVGHEGNKFVLVNPTTNPVESVPATGCTYTGKEPMIELDDVHTNVHKHHLDRSKIGRWIEVTGRLEKYGNQALREVHVDNYRIVPVVPPRYADTAPLAPPEAPEVIPPEPRVELEAVATTGVMEELPKTASPLPLTMLFGGLALAAGLAIGLLRRRAA